MTQVPRPSQRPVDAPVVSGDASTPDSPAAASTGPTAGRWESRPTRPDHPVGWYRTMEPAWATEHFGFPADPKRDDEWTAEDGSVWVFALTGTAWWEMSQYPPAPFRLKLEELVAKHTWPAEAVDDFLADTELLDALVAYRQPPLGYVILTTHISTRVIIGIDSVLPTLAEAEKVLDRRKRNAAANSFGPLGIRHVISELRPLPDAEGEQ